jgi:hypothetical protein
MNAWNAKTNEIVRPDNPIPEKPWLAFPIVSIMGKGRRRYDEDSKLCLLVTHHALSRLTRRCGARKIDDVALAARQIGATFFMNGQQTVNKILRDNTHMKVELPRKMGTAVCQLRRHDDGRGSIVIATLWKEDEEEAQPPGSDPPAC